MALIVCVVVLVVADCCVGCCCSVCGMIGDDVASGLALSAVRAKKARPSQRVGIRRLRVLAALASLLLGCVVVGATASPSLAIRFFQIPSDENSTLPHSHTYANTCGPSGEGQGQAMLADVYSDVWSELSHHLCGQMPYWIRFSPRWSPLKPWGSGGDGAGVSPTLEMGEVASSEVVDLRAEKRLVEKVDAGVVSSDDGSALHVGAGAGQARWRSSKRRSLDKHVSKQQAARALFL